MAQMQREEKEKKEKWKREKLNSLLDEQLNDSKAEYPRGQEEVGRRSGMELA